MANLKLGEILRKLRLENRYTQQDVADMLGIKNKSTLGSWEIGKSEPDGFTLLRLCLIYHVTDIYKTFLDTAVQEDVFAFSDIEQRIILAYRHSDRITKELVHRALGIDISQPDLELEARQEEKLPASGDTGAGEGRRGA